VKAEVQKRHDELNQILRAKALALVEDEVVQVEKFDSILQMNKEKSAAAMNIARERASARDKEEEREREQGRDFEGQGCDVRDEYRRGR
jgi:hypothetical protein